ncbi:hypothetical protein LTR53_004383 [Teratosphaeriaceae sp. CCFEE 6253]|nr:hypothetical protein LTR53_004383 [Teratosphaeriaceae sp. CCFEE 6253]
MTSKQTCCLKAISPASSPLDADQDRHLPTTPAMAVHAVLSTYELVEHILLSLPVPHLLRAAQISRTFRTVRFDSLLIDHYISARHPVTAAEIKPFTPAELEHFGAGTHTGPQRRRFREPVSRAPGPLSYTTLAEDLAWIARRYATGEYRRPLEAIPFDVAPLRLGSHYARLSHGALAIHPSLVCFPGSSGLCGTVVEIQLPPPDHWPRVPGELITTPPITQMEVKLLSPGMIVDRRLLCERTGLTLRHLREAQRELLVDDRAESMGGKVARVGMKCVGVIVRDVEVWRLRSIDARVDYEG